MENNESYLIVRYGVSYSEECGSGVIRESIVKRDMKKEDAERLCETLNKHADEENYYSVVKFTYK